MPARLSVPWSWIPFIACVAALTTRAGRPPPPETLDAGRLAAWRFDATATDFATNAVAEGPRLRLQHATFHAEAGRARSLACDGFTVAGEAEALPAGAFSRGLTLAVWVWPGGGPKSQPLVGRPNANPQWTTPVTGLAFDDGRPFFGLFGPQKKAVVTGPELPARAWSFVVATADGSRLRLWIDGRPATEAPQTIPVPTANLTPWFVGRSLVNFFRGRIGEVHLWSRALDAPEIEHLHRETAVRYPPDRAAAATAKWADRTVLVESPGSRPTGTWLARPTRTLAGLEGYKPTPPPAVDRWGGRTDRPALRATGFFRAERVGDRWWLVTPEGHRYWNVAINSVRAPSSVGTSAQAAWAAPATRELRALGFNGLGNGGMKALREVADPLPNVIRLNFAAAFAAGHKQTYPTSGHTGFTAECVPVFHPDFPAFARRHAQALATDTDDPNIVGIFTDNELQCPSNLLDRHLALDAADPYLQHGRAAALAWLKARGVPADPARFTLKDRYEFIAHVFATYSRIVHEAIRAVDRRHLILGSRFHVHRGQFDNPWFWPAVAPWIDVVSVNYYAHWGPQREQIQEWSDAMQRPLMLTEWYSKAQDAPGLANVLGAGWLVRTQEDRAPVFSKS